MFSVELASGIATLLYSIYAKINTVSSKTKPIAKRIKPLYLLAFLDNIFYLKIIDVFSYVKMLLTIGFNLKIRVF